MAAIPVITKSSSLPPVGPAVLAIAYSARAMALAVACVLGCVLVPTGAMGHSSLTGGRACTPQLVDAISDTLKVVGVEAAPCSTKVINGHAFGDGAVFKFIGDPMNIGLALFNVDHAVAIPIVSAKPKQAPCVGFWNGKVSQAFGYVRTTGKPFDLHAPNIHTSGL